MRRDEMTRLREQTAHKHAELIELHQKAEAEERNFTAEEQSEFEKRMTDFQELRNRSQRAEELWVEEQSVQKALNAPIEMRVGEEDVPLTLNEFQRRRAGERGADVAEYRNAFFKYVTARAVAELDFEEKRALSRATNPAGGFLVPTEMEASIIRSERFMGSVAALSNTITTAGGEPLLVAANTAHGSAVWTAENAAFTPSDETFAQISLNAYKASTKVIVSEELLQDSAFNLEELLSQEFGERIGVLEETAYVNGDGTGKPQGILPNITAITAAVGNTTAFNYTALVSLVFSVPAQYRRGSSFVVNDAAARNMYLMLDSQNRPLWSVNVAVSGPDTFLGYPIYTHPDMPAPAIGAKSVMFGDWRRVYTIRRVQGFSVQRQNELHSDNGQVGFRGWERVDGRVVLADAARAMIHSAT